MKRKYLVNPAAQLGITAYIVLQPFVAVIFMYIMISRGLNAIFDRSVEVGPEYAELIKSNFENILYVLNYSFLVCGTLALVLSIVAGILITHRFFGPIQRLRQTIQEITAGGDPKPMKIRKHDFLKDLIPLIEELAHTRIPRAKTGKQE